jgi:ABC-type branched-subunit amino acid transport system substrate-binding protein
VKKAGVQYPPQQMAEGWIAGMVIEAALKATGWPATTDKLAAAMANLTVDTKGLRGGPIEWTKDNHFRTRQYYRVYRWDTGKNAIVRVKDWQAFDVK